MRSRVSRWIACAALMLAGCGRKPSADGESADVVYEARGVLENADLARGKASIAHEKIPGFMGAMTMEFTAAQPAELASLVPGDVVTFRLRVKESGSRIEQIRKIGHNEPPAPLPQIEPPSETQVLPEVALVDEKGRAFSLSSTKGGALALTFIFTRCPMPDYCPRMNAHFAAVQRELMAAAPSGKWRLLSVTMDPLYDTPARLAEYAERYHPQSDRWTFATGKAAEITRLGTALGLVREGQGATLLHNLRTVVVDAEGRVQREFIGNEWKPAELVEEMKRAMPKAR